jgi:hypothetical protein
MQKKTAGFAICRLIICALSAAGALYSTIVRFLASTDPFAFVTASLHIALLSVIFASLSYAGRSCDGSVRRKASLAVCGAAFIFSAVVSALSLSFASGLYLG